MWNIIIGLVFLVGGLSGYIGVRGINSALAGPILGCLLIAWGIYQMVRSRSNN